MHIEGLMLHAGVNLLTGEGDEISFIAG